jgi:hypothetical protein
VPPEARADPALLAHLVQARIVERDGGWVHRFDPECGASRKPVDAWQLLDRIAAPTLMSGASALDGFFDRLSPGS